MTSAIMAMGLLAGITGPHKENAIAVEAIDAIDVTIAKVLGDSYSYWGCYYVCFVDDTEDLVFKFQVDHDAEVEATHFISYNKVYALTDMSASNSYATINGDKFEYDTVSFELHSDESGYIGYEATVKLDNNVYYHLHEAEPLTGEMAIENYEDQYGSITLTDNETGSKFNFCIDNIENGKTYELNEFSGLKYCFINGKRYWDYRSATFKRAIDDEGLVHIEASVVTEHGDNLQLTYNQTTAEYPLWVGGVQVTGDNASDIFGDGTASFAYEKGDVNKMIVTLNNANITDGYHDHYDKTNGIFTNSSDDLIINLKDGSENSIPNLYYGINAYGNVIISGKGSLNIDASSAGIYIGNQLIVESGTTVINTTGNYSYGITAGTGITFKGGSVTSTATHSGIDSYSGDITIKKGANVTAAGTDYAISGTVKNAIEGTGWTDVAGTEGEAVIEVSESGQNLNSFKKVVFVSHAHVWDEKWTSDATHHWHACLADDAEDECLLEEEAAYGEHAYGETGDARFTCTVCGHVDNAKKAAAKLNDAKEAAKKELDNLLAGKNESDYDPEDWAAIKQIIETAKAEIDSATSVAAVDTTKIDATKKVAAVKTSADKVDVQPKSGLPAGAVVGITLGSIFGVALIACGVLFLLHKKGIIVIPFLKKKEENQEQK